MTIRKVHYFSGLIISIFVGLHLFNHCSSIFGAEFHISLMEKFRMVYRNLVVESILLIAVCIQIISGVKLFFLQRKNKNTFFEKLQIWSGLYLASFLVIHVSAVLGGRLIFNLDTNFYFGVAGLNTFPFNLFFIPYYGLAILAFFGHVASIYFQKMKKEILGLKVDKQSKIILGIGVILTVVIFYGLTNGFSGVEIPSEYDMLIGR